MQRTLPQEIVCEEFAGSVTYVLPPRQLGKVHRFGLIFTFVGILVMCLLPWRSLGEIPHDHMMTAVIPVIIILGGFLVAWRCAILGLVIWGGHARIRLANGKLIVSERFGPFRWSRKYRTDRIRSIALVHSPDEKIRINGQLSDKFPELARTGMLLAYHGRKMPGFVLVAYPKTWLFLLGEDIAGRLGIPFKDVGESRFENDADGTNSP